MTYDETIKMIERIVKAHPAVKSFYYGSVLRVNQERDWDYPVAVLSPRVTTMTNGFYRFGFVLWYIDILSKERTEFQAIQSDAIQTLTQIGLAITDEDNIISEMAPISVFSERFADVCAGAMCDLTITAAGPVCPPEI